MNGLNEHWPDLAFSAFLALLGWLGNRAFARMDKRHERAENKFEEMDDTLNAHETRISVLEARRS